MNQIKKIILQFKKKINLKPIIFCFFFITFSLLSSSNLYINNDNNDKKILTNEITVSKMYYAQLLNRIVIIVVEIKTKKEI